MTPDTTIHLDTLALLAGSHDSPSDGMCVMEAVAYVAGEPFSDHPECACPVIGAFLRNWNDALPDDATRTRLLAPLIPRLVGSTSTKAVELRRSYLALDWLARECAPTWLSLRDDLRAHAVALRGLAPLTDAQSCKAARAALDAAGAAAGAAAWDAAWAAAWAAARDALAPTVAMSQASALDLVQRMLAEGAH